MAYLLDTNTLIQAKNEYYAFDLCPGFWDWLALKHQQGTLYSIEPVLEEIRDGQDELVDWANDCPTDFFLPIDAATTIELGRIVQWVQASEFKDAAKRDFLSKADPLLIAYAKAHGYILVSHEVHIEGERRKVKIPTVAQVFDVPCVRTFEMLRSAYASFVLRSGLELL